MLYVFITYTLNGVVSLLTCAYIICSIMLLEFLVHKHGQYTGVWTYCGVCLKKEIINEYA